MTQWTSSMIAVLFVVTASGVAGAQPASPSPSGSQRTSVGLLAGFTGGSGDTGGSIGGLAAFDLTDGVAVEGRGIYMQRGRGTMGFELTGTMLLTVARGNKAAPYVAVGEGLYRARFDLGDDRFLGRMGSQFAAGSRFVPIHGMSGFGMMSSGMTFNGNVWTGPWTGPTFSGSQMPMFYTNRLGQMMVPADGRWGTLAFTDPALTLGGGLRLDVTDQLFVRPDVRALVVFDHGNRMVLTTATVGVGYRF